MADSVSKKAKNAIKQLLSTAQYDGEDAFTDVIGTTEGENDSYPLVRVLPGDQTTTKGSVRSNDRTLAYICRVTLPLEPQKQSEDTYDHMYDLTDLIIDTLDTADNQGTLTQIDPTLPTWILNATRGDWFVVDASGGSTLTCDVNVGLSYTRES